MPAFSAFTGFGFLRFSSGPSEAEKVYRSLQASFRDPKTGQPTLDLSEGTYQEAKIYAWALAIAAARVGGLQSAGDELKPETSYYQLEKHEKRFSITPAATDTVVTRQAALLARRKIARGPRYEAMVEALSAILGSNFVAYRPVKTSEAEAYPTAITSSPGLFLRHDRVAKSVRFLSAVARGVKPTVFDSYPESNSSGNYYGVYWPGSAFQVLQSFRAGFSGTLAAARVELKKLGSPTGSVYAKIYPHAGTFGTSSVGAGDPLTGTPLATSEALDISTLTTTGTVKTLAFTGSNKIALSPWTPYMLAVEYMAGNVSNALQVGVDQSSPTHQGNAVRNIGAWDVQAGHDLLFYVDIDADYFQTEVAYENWNTNLADAELVAGDVLCVDPGNWALAEKVTVVSSRTESGVRYFTGKFKRPHSDGAYATDGPIPLWGNTKRHVLVVVKSAAAVDPVAVARVDALLRRVMRGPTTWAVVQATTDGAATLGPFKVGTTLGSPLGAVPLESITI
jgi:hypothetical protein